MLRLLPTQLSTREIGRELYVSVNTVRSQVQAVYRKLEVATRTEAIAGARQLGLLPPGRPLTPSRTAAAQAVEGALLVADQGADPAEEVAGRQEAASGCRCRQARAGPTCPPQRVRCNGCSPRLHGPGSHQECPSIWPSRHACSSEAVASVQLCALFLIRLVPSDPW